MRTKTALVELLKSNRDYRVLFKGCCETSAFRLRAQAWQFREELAKRGYFVALEEAQDTLFELARSLFPDSPAAQWDAEWASRLCREALARLGERYTELTEDERKGLDLSGQDPHEEAVSRAGYENNPAAFRLALAEWERAGCEAFEAARSKRGAVA